MATRSRISAYLALATLSAWAATACASETDGDAELEQVRAKLTEMFKSVDPEDVRRSPVDGWYTVQQGSVIAYITGDGRYLMQGDLIDLTASVNLTEESRNEARREILADIGDDDVITFAPDDPKYAVTVFTDIDCSYCRRLHSQIKEYLASGIEVRYLLYPRSGPASKSWNTAEQVWCAPDRNNALTLAKLDRKFETESCDASIVDRHYKLGHDVGLSGTPAIVLDDGELIAGYLPPEALRMRLEQKASEQQAAAR